MPKSESLKQSDPEQFYPVAHDKRAMRAICSFSRANHSFAHKKTSNFLKKPMSKFPTLAQTYMQYIKLSWFTELAVKSARRVRGTFAAKIQHTTLCHNQWCGSGSVFVDPDPYHWLYLEIFIKAEHWNLLQIYTLHILWDYYNYIIIIIMLVWQL